MRAHAYGVVLRFRFGFQDLATTVKASRADVVAQMNFTCGGLYCDARHIQCVVRAVHAALGRGFFVLLDGHVPLLIGTLMRSRHQHVGW